MSTAPPSVDDFTLLHAGARALGERNRRTVLWMMGLALLIIATVLALLWYLQRFERAEEERQRSADAQWLEQSVQFHFRRLEDDVAQRARQVAIEGPQALASSTPGAADGAAAGLLWRAPGVVTARAWLASNSAGAGTPAATSGGDLQAWQDDMNHHGDNATSLRMLQDVAASLRHASYAGPMRRSDGSSGDRVWLAVPSFDGPRLAGLYVVALSMQHAVDALLPAWFADKQAVRLAATGAQAPALTQEQIGDSYRTVMGLPGSDLMLEVVPQGSQASPIPRIFFGVALTFLLGMLVSLAALRRDFIKRQQVQQRLQAEVAMRSAMEHSATIGLRAWDMRRRILYVNQAFCAMVGYGARELLGASAPLPCWPQEQGDELVQLSRLAKSASAAHHPGLETRLRHKSGQLVDVLIHEAPLLAADGTQLGWMSSVLDISERKRAQQLAAEQQEKLDASERLVAVGEVASTLAHELNQPLGALASFANGLLNRLRAGTIALADMEPVVQRMAQLAERAGGVTQRVNAFARKRELNLVRLDLQPLVRRAGASAQEGQPTSIALQLPDAPVPVLGDALLLEHLVNNLCANALDWAGQGAGGAPARVVLRLRPLPGDEVALEVADSGPGVPEAAQARIFDAFYSTKDGGMGMGLAICRSITEAHHGRMLVGRDAALGGALFTAILPLAGHHTPDA